MVNKFEVIVIAETEKNIKFVQKAKVYLSLKIKSY